MEISDLKTYLDNPTDPDQSEFFLSFIDDVISAGEYDEKQELLEFLSEFLSRSGQAIEDANAATYEAFQVSWLKLAFSAFIVLETQDQDNLLQKKIFTAIQKGFDPDQLVRSFFVYYQGDDLVKEKFHHFVEALEQNTETLGSLPIEVEGKRMLPTIKYWLLDYAKFPSRNARRGSVERLNYLTQSANVRQLTQGQRQNLSKLMKLYDDFIAPERPMDLRDRSNEAGPEVQTIPTPPPVSAAPAPMPQTVSAPNIEDMLNKLKQRSQK